MATNLVSWSRVRDERVAGTTGTSRVSAARSTPSNTRDTLGGQSRKTVSYSEASGLRRSDKRLVGRLAESSSRSMFRYEKSAGSRSRLSKSVPLIARPAKVRPLTNALTPPRTFGRTRNRKLAAPCGSRSHNKVRLPPLADRYARFTAAEVLPTPPLML